MPIIRQNALILVVGETRDALRMVHQAAGGWPRAFHPDDKAGTLEIMGRVIRKSGMRGEFEARLRRVTFQFVLPLHEEDAS